MAGLDLPTRDDGAIDRAYETILAARVELHRATNRASDQLLLEQQDAVAAALGYDDADLLMADVAGASRTIAWISDQLWDEVRRQGRRPWPFGSGREDGAEPVSLAADANVGPVTALEVGVEAARRGVRIDRTSLLRLQAEAPAMPEPWPPGARDAFADLLLAGKAAIPIVEDLDQSDVFVRILPEWEPTRSRPQRNPYHTYTVDRHLCEAAAQAAELADRVDRPDLLVVGALLHDIGKGYPGDHTEVGMELVATIATRMGFPPSDVDTLVAMVEHHLLLPDVATRRDLEDDGTISTVAEAVGQIDRLQLLAALTEADSIATGPSAWSRWKANLVDELVARSAHVLAGGDVADITANFPTDEQRQLMREGQSVVRGEGSTLLVIVPDRPALFSRVAGTLALNGLEVLGAAAHTEYGMALEQFEVEPTFDEEIDWGQVAEQVERALNGRLAIEARIVERRALYRRRRAAPPRRIVESTVLVDNEISNAATVIEVRAPNTLGLLYRVTQALAQLDLNILSAKVQTLGDDVVDSFYVNTRADQKATEVDHLDEIERALLNAMRERQ